MILRTCALLFTLLATASHLAGSQIEEFTKVMAGDDSTAKRSAVQSLSGTDDEVLPLLVQAVGDRQASEAAINALRSRTGLRPAAKRGQSHYPNYPSGDTAGDWSTWLTERKREKDQEAKVKEAEKIAKEAKKTADKTQKKAEGKADPDKAAGAGADAEKDPADKTPADGEEAAKDPAEAEAPKKRVNQPPPEDLGKLDRIVFKNGSSMLCYILTRRTDADGNLLSVRVIHPDGAGEEILQAALIARLEEDVK
ncbi:MAG: hypothetical protein H0V44_10005 [Planctomycetes bacterium]|nr:hypothetical protein [Planctomycetota bacterium]